MGPSAGVVEAEESVDIRVLVEERGHAGGVLRALNHAAGKRRGGHFVAEESDGAGTAGAQPAGQTVGQVTEFGGDVADSLGDIGADAADIAVVEHQRDGGDGNAGAVGDLLHRDHGSTSLLASLAGCGWLL